MNTPATPDSTPPAGAVSSVTSSYDHVVKWLKDLKDVIAALLVVGTLTAAALGYFATQSELQTVACHLDYLQSEHSKDSEYQTHIQRRDAAALHLDMLLKKEQLSADERRQTEALTKIRDEASQSSEETTRQRDAISHEKQRDCVDSRVFSRKNKK